jgi:hypothetical protein
LLTQGERNAVSKTLKPGWVLAKLLIRKADRFVLRPNSIKSSRLDRNGRNAAAVAACVGDDLYD